MDEWMNGIAAEVAIEILVLLQQPDSYPSTGEGRGSGHNGPPIENIARNIQKG